MECYKEFAYIYDELINNDIDYKKWSEKIILICDENHISKDDYLDLACGTGNLTQFLSNNFKHTFAVDLSQDMLTEADKKLRTNLNRPKFVCQDICSLNLNKKFDLVTCCLDSTNYLTTEEQIKSYFKSVSDHLKENGLFIFDINSYHKLTEVLGNNSFNYDSEDVVYIWDNCLENEIVDMYLTFFVKCGDMYKRFDEEHSERAYKEEFIEELINTFGMKVVKKLDNYEDKPIKSTTERITYVVTKDK